MQPPSRRIFPLIVIALLLVSGFVYFTIFYQRSETYVAPKISVSATSALLAKDSDGDGLKDWEEQLWKTDPARADTDGDGTPDGAEIKAGRDPLTAGPNDRLPDETVEKKVNTETEGDLSQTDKFSRDLFLRIVAAKKANQPPTEQDLEKFLNTVIDEELKNQPAEELGEGDFQIDGAETPEKIRSYGNEIARILTEKPAETLEYELDVYERAEKNNNPEELKKLEPLIAQYKRIEEGLRSIAVPASALAQHVAFTTSIAGMAHSITGLRYILTDPIKALPGVASYDENAVSFITTVRQFKTYFESAGVAFEEGDRAYGFFENL